MPYLVTTIKEFLKVENVEVYILYFKGTNCSSMMFFVLSRFSHWTNCACSIVVTHALALLGVCLQYKRTLFYALVFLKIHVLQKHSFLARYYSMMDF